jgi:transcriptional regulator with XRE-family HTH domain
MPKPGETYETIIERAYPHSQKLRLLRGLLSATARDLVEASKGKIGRHTIENAERRPYGSMSPETLDRLAALLGVPGGCVRRKPDRDCIIKKRRRSESDRYLYRKPGARRVIPNGKAVRAAREAAGLSRDALVKKLYGTRNQLSLSTIKHLEGGRRRGAPVKIQTLMYAASALKAPLEELILEYVDDLPTP